MGHIKSASTELGFRAAVAAHKPLKIMGTPVAYSAIMAQKRGYAAIYLSGASVANLLHGIADEGLTSLNNVLQAAVPIVAATPLPLLVDIDTGFADIVQTIASMEALGVAAVHLEDQDAQAKRCGHLDGKVVVSLPAMVDRLVAAVAARLNPDFVIMARTDALAVEGLDATIARAQAYVAAGADMIFAEALETLDQYRVFCAAVDVPVLANCTEFGKTPLFHCDELSEQGVAMVLYPRSVERMMTGAADKLLQEVDHQGTQSQLSNQMQARVETQAILDYAAQQLKK